MVYVKDGYGIRTPRRNLYDKLYERDGGICGICKQPLKENWERYLVWRAWHESKDPQRGKQPFKRISTGITIDHINPKSRMRQMGHPPHEVNAITNLQLAHSSCNNAKGNRYEPCESSTSDSETAMSAERQPTPQPQESTTVVKTSGSASTPSAATGVKSQPWYKEAEEAYNAMARVWNSLPGNRLIYPQDKFEIRYCYHSSKERKVVSGTDRFGKTVKYPYCNLCGYPLPGAYDS